MSRKSGLSDRYANRSCPSGRAKRDREIGLSKTRECALTYLLSLDEFLT